VKFREEVYHNKNGNSVDILFKLEDIMYEIRKDMGNKKLKKGQLLSFFISDIDEYTSSKKKD